jgi:hypothetical protein
MRTWIRSISDAILGKVTGKTSRLDTATRMAMGADFSMRGSSPTPLRTREADDGHLITPIGPSADAALFEHLVRVVNESQAGDAEDERLLYKPVRVAGPAIRQRGPTPRSRF